MAAKYVRALAITAATAATVPVAAIFAKSIFHFAVDTAGVRDTFVEFSVILSPSTERLLDFDFNDEYSTVIHLLGQVQSRPKLG